LGLAEDGLLLFKVEHHKILMEVSEMEYKLTIINHHINAFIFMLVNQIVATEAKNLSYLLIYL